MKIYPGAWLKSAARVAETQSRMATNHTYVEIGKKCEMLLCKAVLLLILLHQGPI